MSNPIDDGYGAFPYAPTGDGQGQPYPHAGMSLRDWFAGQAIMGISVSDRFVRDADSNAAQARWAYELADAMIAARKAKP